MRLPLSTVTGSLRADIWINCPSPHVWNCVLEFPKWAPTIKAGELISGGWDKEGGVVLITKEDGLGVDPFFSTNLKMRPHSQMVYKIDTKDGDQQHGFVDITLLEAGDKTRVIYSNYMNFQFPMELTLEDLQGNQAVERIRDEYYLKPLKEYSEKTWK